MKNPPQNIPGSAQGPPLAPGAVAQVRTCEVEGPGSGRNSQRLFDTTMKTARGCYLTRHCPIARRILNFGNCQSRRIKVGSPLRRWRILNKTSLVIYAHAVGFYHEDHRAVAADKIYRGQASPFGKGGQTGSTRSPFIHLAYPMSKRNLASPGICGPPWKPKQLWPA